MRTYPILRLTIFLAAGIFFAGCFPDCCSLQNLNWVLWILILLLGVWGIKPSYSGRWLFGAGVSCVMFLVGWMLSEHERQLLTVKWSEEKQVYRAVISDIPVKKAKSIQCKVNIENRVVLLYISKDSLSSTLRISDELLFYAQVQSPKNQGNPYEFDYARYLYHQGISGTAYAYSGYWAKSKHVPELGLKQKALMTREYIKDKFTEWGLGEEQFPVVTALTLGCKKELDEEVRRTYSEAGISHVLALSGMHIGIVWMLLDFLLRPLGLVRGGRWMKGFLSIVALWSFAFVVGLEASVVRAVVMCMLMELAKLAGRKSLSMNTLAIAAFVMLWYRPSYLYDVGFQLSFVAVASIILFYPLIFRTVPWRNRWLRNIGGVVAVSISAQLGTAPLVMYYFSSFSVYFLLANLVAAFLVPFIIYVAIIMVVVSPFGQLLTWVVWLLNRLAEGLTDVARHVSELPGSTFSLSRISALEIWIFYGILAVVYLYTSKARRNLLIKGGVLFVCLLVVHLWMVFPQEKSAELVFYNIRNCPAVQLIESDGASFVVTEKGDSAIDLLERVAGPFWKKEKVKHPLELQELTDGFAGTCLENIIAWHGKRFAFLSDNRWKDKMAEQLMTLDYLYLCKGCNQQLKDLQRLFRIRKVVLDASLSKNRVEDLKAECRELGIDFVDLAAEGSLRIFL